MQWSERYALTALCEELIRLRTEFEHQPEERRRLLARIEVEAKARRPILGLLAELLDTSAEETTRALGAGLPGIGAGQADEERFVCPDSACDRASTTLPAGQIPRCLLTGAPMRRA